MFVSFGCLTDFHASSNTDPSETEVHKRTIRNETCLPLDMSSVTTTDVSLYLSFLTYPCAPLVLSAVIVLSLSFQCALFSVLYITSHTCRCCFVRLVLPCLDLHMPLFKALFTYCRRSHGLQSSMEALPVTVFLRNGVWGSCLGVLSYLVLPLCGLFCPG